MYHDLKCHSPMKFQPSVIWYTPDANSGAVVDADGDAHYHQRVVRENDAEFATFYWDAYTIYGNDTDNT